MTLRAELIARLSLPGVVILCLETQIYSGLALVSPRPIGSNRAIEIASVSFWKPEVVPIKVLSCKSCCSIKPPSCHFLLCFAIFLDSSSSILHITARSKSLQVSTPDSQQDISRKQYLSSQSYSPIIAPLNKIWNLKKDNLDTILFLSHSAYIISPLLILSTSTPILLKLNSHTGNKENQPLYQGFRTAGRGGSIAVPVSIWRFLKSRSASIQSERTSRRESETEWLRRCGPCGRRHDCIVFKTVEHWEMNCHVRHSRKGV